MEPFTIAAVILFSGGLSTTVGKIFARKSYRKASQRYQGAVYKAHLARNEAALALNSFARQRQGSMMFLGPRVGQASEALDAGPTLFGPVNGVFGGRTFEELTSLVERACKKVVGPDAPIDGTVMLTSGAALLIEGVEYLDRTGAIGVDALHHTVGEAISSMTGASPETVTEMIGGLGDLPVIDLMGDALVVLSIVRLGYNIWKINDFVEKKGELEEHSIKIEETIPQFAAMRSEAEAVEREVHETSYELYKWTFAAQVAAQGKSVIAPSLRARLISGLRRAGGAWWSALDARPKTAGAKSEPKAAAA